MTSQLVLLYQQIFTFQESIEIPEKSLPSKSFQSCVGTRRNTDDYDTMWIVAFYPEVVTSTLQKHMAVDPSQAGNGGFGVLISYHGIDSLAETSRLNRSEPEKVRSSR